MALTRCWRQRAKAIPAQVTWALLGIILELFWVASGPRDVPWGDFGVSPGVVARVEGSSAGNKQPQSHITEPILAFSLWKLRERGISTQKMVGIGPGMVARIWGTRGNSFPEPRIVLLEGFMGLFGLQSWSQCPGTKRKFLGAMGSKWSLWDGIKMWICC